VFLNRDYNDVYFQHKVPMTNC